MGASLHLPSKVKSTFRAHSGCSSTLAIIQLMSTRKDPTFAYLTAMELQALVSIARRTTSKPDLVKSHNTTPNTHFLPPCVYQEMKTPKYLETSTTKFRYVAHDKVIYSLKFQLNNDSTILLYSLISR